MFGTGSSTNAYTDFHHTVFYASCPVLTPPGWGRPTPMLGRALGALLDVLEVRCEVTGRFVDVTRISCTHVSRIAVLALVSLEIGAPV